ncbi:MAG: hypothetical protein ABIG39_03885 [Candidatus Micrarchaeota archaeon]
MTVRREGLVLAFVLLFSATLFLFVPRDTPHVVSYKYALGTKNVIVAGGGDEPFYEFSGVVYRLVWGEGFDQANFETLVMYLPVLFGLVCVVAIFVSIRTRLGLDMALLGTVFLCCSPAFLVNTLVGVYTPEMLGLATFSLSLMLFLLADVIKPRWIGYVLASLSGLALGINLLETEVGILLAAGMGSSALVQLVYYIKEGKYKQYAVRFALLLLFTAPFLQYAKFSDVERYMDVGGAIHNYVLILPLVGIFSIVAIRDLIHDTKKYELFVLAITVASVGIAVFDPVAAAPGMTLGAIFGLVAIGKHADERFVVLVFVCLVSAAAFFLVIENHVQQVERAFVLSLVAGMMLGGLFILYDNAVMRKKAVFAGVTLIVAISLVNGVLAAQRQYAGISVQWGEALAWAKQELPDDAVLGVIGPDGLVEYVAERDGCNCNDVIARYLLGGGGTESLKTAGVTHILVDEGYFNDLGRISSIGNVTRLPMETYLFIGYFQENQNFYAYLTSGDGGSMSIPVDASGTPSGEDVLVAGVGRVPYGRVRLFDSGSGPIGPGSRAVLPLQGGRINLFDIYFESPVGLELIYPEHPGAVRIYKLS